MNPESIPFPKPETTCPIPVQIGEGLAGPAPSGLPQGNMDAPPIDDEQLALLQTMVRFVESPPAKNGPSEMMLNYFLAGIKTGYWRKFIDAIRNTPDIPVTLCFAQERKLLPGVVFAGTFNEGAPPKLIPKHTGLMGLLFVSNDSPGLTDTEIKAILVKDPHVVACWKPVENRGIEGIVRIRPDFDFHKKSFTAADVHYQNLGLTIDSDAWYNSSRLCQISDDPDLWINPNRVVEINPEGVAIELLDVGNDDSTPFPMSCLPGVAGEMAREIARVTTSGNEALAAASIIGVVSAALGAGIEFSAGGERRTRANLYLMALVVSGNGKGETSDLATAPLIAFERHSMEAFQRDQLPSLISELNVITSRVKHLTKMAAKETDPGATASLLKNLQAAESKKKDLERKIGAVPRLLVSDATKEKLAIVMQDQPGEALASMTSEAGGVLNVIQGRYNKMGGDEEFYNSAYSGDNVTVDRVSRNTVALARPCLTVLWMVQPYLFDKLLKKDSMTASGFLPRFLVFDPHAEPQARDERPCPIPQGIKSGWHALIHSLLQAYRARPQVSSVPYSVAVSSEALQVLGDYERENIKRRQSAGDLNDIAPYVARWSENASRLALVLHCAEHGVRAHEISISQESAHNAVQVMRWFSGRQLSLLNAGRRKLLEKRVLELMEILQLGDKPIRELERSYGFKKGEIERLNAMFPKLVHIASVKPPGGGRPSPMASVKSRAMTLDILEHLIR